MTTPNLAKIERVDLREAWTDEARNFTPWLANNLDHLSEALNISLQFRKKEAPVGRFFLDILAVDLDSDRHVVIENQLGTADHTHLGQLMAYAAWFDAETVVWITRDFGDEHRQAIDWLNQHTDKDTQFFCVVVELWRIGNSPLAPHFRVVSSPSGWVKSAKPAIPPSPSGKFRQSLRDTCDAHGVKYSGRPGGNWHWLNFEHPVKNVRYEATWQKGKPGLQVIIDMQGDDGRVWNQKIFKALELHRLEIDDDLVESEEDESPIWQNTECKAGTRIIICRTGSIFNDTESWDEFQDWMIQKLYKFREVFTPRLQKLIKQEQPTIE